jgi:hypothetical protein
MCRCPCPSTGPQLILGMCLHFPDSRGPTTEPVPRPAEPTSLFIWMFLMCLLLSPTGRPLSLLSRTHLREFQGPSVRPEWLIPMGRVPGLGILARSPSRVIQDLWPCFPKPPPQPQAETFGDELHPDTGHCLLQPASPPPAGPYLTLPVYPHPIMPTHRAHLAHPSLPPSCLHLLPTMHKGPAPRTTVTQFQHPPPVHTGPDGPTIPSHHSC